MAQIYHFVPYYFHVYFAEDKPENCLNDGKCDPVSSLYVRRPLAKLVELKTLTPWSVDYWYPLTPSLRSTLWNTLWTTLQTSPMDYPQ